MSQVDDIEAERASLLKFARLQEKEALEFETIPSEQQKKKEISEISNLKTTIRQLQQSIVCKEDRITALQNDIMDIREHYEKISDETSINHLEKLEQEISQLKEEAKLTTEELERKLLWKMKVKNAPEDRTDMLKCTWCQKSIKRGKLTHINNLGNFCPECLARRKEANGRR